MRKRDHNVLTNAASLLVCGLLAGVVVAAAAFPAVAMSGLAAKAGAETFDKLPSALTVKTAPQMSYIYASDGKTLLATMYDENRRDVKLADIAPRMQKAIIAAEDHDFYKHNGVDMKGVARAFVNNSSGTASQQGASTLTMQYVRLAISYSATHPQDVIAATEDTPARKLKEMRYAMQIDRDLSKDEILERYLNIAAFGNGAYGIFAASQTYFGKHPKDLKLEEAALLAGMVKAPTAFDPTTVSGKPQALDRRNYIIQNMLELGSVTPEEAAAATAAPLVVKGKRAPNGCVDANKKDNWGFFCDYFYRWWMAQETFGATSYDRERRLKGGGYRIVSSLDVQAQAGAQRAVLRSQKTTSTKAALVAAVEPGTGRVRAMAVNRVFKLDDPNKPQNKLSSDPKKRAKKLRGTVPNTTNPLISGGGDIKGYQAGSTFKMFTMVAALEKGIPLQYTINAEKQFKSEYVIQRNSPAACPGTHFYCPTNASDSMVGAHNMWSAFGSSVNTYFVPLQQRVGAENVVAAAKKLGITFRTQEDLDLEKGAHQWGAFTLGVSQTTPLELANSYATLAADGKYCEPIPVQEILDQEGKKLDIANPRCKQVVATEVARAAVDAARCPVGDRSSTSQCKGATARNVRGIVGHPVAGKSGTTDSEKTASLVAMTKQLAVAGIMADPDWPQTNQKMGHNEKGGINAPVYETLRDAMKGKDKIDFVAPNGKAITGDQRPVPDVKCQSVDTAKSRIKGAGFEVAVDNTKVASSCPAGTVARTSPEGRAVKGGLVMLEISAGPGAPAGGNTGGTGPGTPGTGPGRPPGRR